MKRAVAVTLSIGARRPALLSSQPPPMNRLSAALCALACTALPGCFLSRSYVNDPLDRAALASLEPGRTTAFEVVQALGAPTQVVELGDRSAYEYEHRRLKRTGLFLFLIGMLNEDTRADRVWVFFDADDRLTHVGATLSADLVEYSLPWGDR